MNRTFLEYFIWVRRSRMAFRPKAVRREKEKAAGTINLVNGERKIWLMSPERWRRELISSNGGVAERRARAARKKINNRDNLIKSSFSQITHSDTFSLF